jgi:hypothetical protein
LSEIVEDGFNVVAVLDAMAAWDDAIKGQAHQK